MHHTHAHTLSLTHAHTHSSTQHKRTPTHDETIEFFTAGLLQTRKRKRGATPVSTKTVITTLYFQLISRSGLLRKYGLSRPAPPGAVFRNEKQEGFLINNSWRGHRIELIAALDTLMKWKNAEKKFMSFDIFFLLSSFCRTHKNINQLFPPKKQHCRP